MSSIRADDEWSSTYGDIGSQPRKELRELPLRSLVPWTDSAGGEQPFGYSSQQFDELVASIQAHGVIEPIHVRPMGGRFQIIAGHHRTSAALKSGLNTIPALIEDMDDDAAAVQMVDSNLIRRDDIDPVTLGRAYRIKLEALRRKYGNKKAEEMLTVDTGKGRATIYRYIRLTYLTGVLAKMAATKKLKLAPGVELSYMDTDAQALVAEAISGEQIKAPNIEMAKAIRTLYDDGSLDEDSLLALYEDDGDEEEPETPLSRFRAFFPDAGTDDDLLDQMYQTLQKYLNA